MSHPSQGLENWLLEGGRLPTPASVSGAQALGKALILAALWERERAPLGVVFNSGVEARNAFDHLNFLLGGSQSICFLPAPEFDFHKGLYPNLELIYERNRTLYQTQEASPKIFLTTARALLHKFIPRNEFFRATVTLQQNEEWERPKLQATLFRAGYTQQPVTYDPGTFALRGGVIDIFSPLYPNPFRLDFYGDFIESIRFFDPHTQRSLNPVDCATLLPAGQSLLPNLTELQAISPALKKHFDDIGMSKADREKIFETISLGNLTGSLFYLYPFLSGGSDPILNYFPKGTLWVTDGLERIQETTEEKEWPTLEKHFDQFTSASAPIAPLEDLFIHPKELWSTLKQKTVLGFRSFLGTESDNSFTLFEQPVTLKEERESGARQKDPHSLMEALAKRFHSWREAGYRIHLVTHTQLHADKISRLFEPYGLETLRHEENQPALQDIFKVAPGPIHLWHGYLRESTCFEGLRVILLSEEAIFGQKKRISEPGRQNLSQHKKTLGLLRTLVVNDYVVHKDQGIGRYLGLKSMPFQGIPNDYALIEYRDGDKLYVPVYHLNVIQKYSGGENAAPPLDKLGGERWSKAKSKAKRAATELAAELLQIHAQRKLVTTPSLSRDAEEFQEFEMEFPFDETADQLRAIEETLEDLTQGHPMDRIVVGDVGYGKTEVAMRAAYLNVLAGRQVAVLVPTTVLAFQHFETFRKRFQNSPMRIESLSRLRKPLENRKTLEDLKAGKVDILIGTHRLLSQDVQFKNLGLLVLDEEHRFGVVHKEKLKKLCHAAHVLTLTATPIPRTLNMAMAGIKDISLITTPPPDRLSVRTFVCRDSDEVILEAIQNELARDGQVFLLHNRIQSIGKVAERIRQLLPKVTLAVAHGQMPGATLEKIMLDFYQKRFQLLISTAIIESGLDIPNANTILIDQAHALGLAQLYQLRGRVGRSDRRAYCYLLVPSESLMTEDARQRLQVLQRYTDLGSGFHISNQDLEIRGSGDLLGKEQSGHLNAIGLDLYLELLEESIRYLQGQEKQEQIEPEIHMRIAAYFPTDYLPDVTERVTLYRRLSSVEDEDQIAEIESEIRDRFGTPPTEVFNLIGLMRIKLSLKQLCVTHLACGPKRISLQFAPSTPVTPQAIIKWIQKSPQKRALTPDNKLVFEADASDWKSVLREIDLLSTVLK